MPEIFASVLGSIALPHLLGRVLHGLDDIDVAGAAAEIARDRLADVLLARVLVALEERHTRHHHARSAVAALQSVLLGEALLHRMQLSALLEAFDRTHLRTVCLHCEHRARLHRLTVEYHGAGAAMRGVAADVGTREAQPLPDEMNQQQPRLDFGGVRGPIYGHSDLVHGHDHRPPARSTALTSARATMTRAISFLYSTEPRRSALGAVFAAASRAASAIAFASGILPTSERAASTASTGVGPALVSAIAARSTAPLASSVSCTAAAAAAKSPTLRLSFT